MTLLEDKRYSLEIILDGGEAQLLLWDRAEEQGIIFGDNLDKRALEDLAERIEQFSGMIEE